MINAVEYNGENTTGAYLLGVLASKTKWTRENMSQRASNWKMAGRFVLKEDVKKKNKNDIKLFTLPYRFHLRTCFRKNEKQK